MLGSWSDPSRQRYVTLWMLSSALGEKGCALTEQVFASLGISRPKATRARTTSSQTVMQSTTGTGSGKSCRG